MISKEKVRDLSNLIKCYMNTQYSPENSLENTLSNWLEQNPQDHISVDEEQEFWVSAPKWANWYVEDLYGCHYWFENEPAPFHNEWMSQGGNSKKVAPVKRFWHNTLKQRPTPPAPKVEVGQVWSYGVFDVRVIGVNAIVVAYQGINNNDIETTDIRDFLAKFERVGGSE
jgi:hypothetical protein